MNLILLQPDDFVAAGRVRLVGRRLDHMTDIHRAGVGDELIVGRLDGPIGRGRITRIDREALLMDVTLDRDPPPPMPVVLVLALPRPPVLRRVLIAATSMGVKRIHLIGCRAVEKSYWQSRALAEAAVREQLFLGLEQGRDTRLPSVLTHRRFRPFVEDELPALAHGRAAFVAHPGEHGLFARGEAPGLVAVGPEGGFSDYEVERLCEAGLAPISLGERPLRVETAVPALLAPWL